MKIVLFIMVILFAGCITVKPCECKPQPTTIPSGSNIYYWHDNLKVDTGNLKFVWPNDVIKQ